MKGRQSWNHRRKGGGRVRERDRGRESGLPCRMSKRGGEEAELHQMK